MAKNRKPNEDLLYDELLSYLGDPLFQIPVRTYMDTQCIIFDPSCELTPEHTEIHNKYKGLVDTLLESFCNDVGITIESAIQGITKLNQIPDLREVFKVLFEQVMAATDFSIFCQVMIKRNIAIQEQVLMMILAGGGVVPQSLTAGGQGSAQPSSAEAAPVDDMQEEEVFREVIKKSEQQAKIEQDAHQKEEEELKRVIEQSKQEMGMLQRERTRVEEELVKDLSGTHISGGATAATGAAAATSAGSSQLPKSRPPVQAPPASTTFKSPMPAIPPGKKDVSSGDAASNWLKSAQAEVNSGTSAHQAMAASMAKMTPEELAARQEYLREQRDKLLAMKKDVRSKQLDTAEKSNPGRPQSACAARKALNSEEAALSAEDEKKQEMRRAIAEKLRAEVINKQ